ncbi:PIN domain-containing protein [Halorubrum trueperi]|uniref:PIN domain-containing protein n=1 Tax=Halorubrum trueperi TaxID=2004704 RepID=A0ABD5UKC9_9EURY
MILDTAFFISLFKRTPAAFSKGSELADAGIVQRIPSPVMYELQYGVEIGGNEDESRMMENLAHLYPVVEVDDRLARQAGRLCATADTAAGGVDQAGIDDIDPLVAAVADEYNEPVLTRNAKDFRKLGVEVETY